MNTTNTDRDELRGILDTLAYKHSCDGYIKNGDPHDIGVIPDEVTNAKRLIEALIATKVREARIDENESVVEAVSSGYATNDWCHLHDKHVAQCFACREAKWGNYFVEKFRVIVAERLSELKADSKEGV